MINPEEFVGNGWAGVWSERWVSEAEAVITSLGLELADLEREPQGLLRVSIDSPNGITVDDCERVSHQLSRLFEVDNVVYDRLEVSSPGVERALRRKQDFDRFVGVEVNLKLKRAVNNQKNFKGILEVGSETAYCLVVQPEGKNAEPYQLNFEIADVAGARLVAHLKF